MSVSRLPKPISAKQPTPDERKTEVGIPSVHRSSFFSRLEVSGASLQKLATNYRQWVLGLGPYFFARDRRLKSGVKEGWKLEQLKGNVSLHGLYGLNIMHRESENEVLISFVHMDQLVIHKVWENLVRLRAVNETVILEHGMRCSVPSGAGEGASSLIVEPPVVLRRILEMEELEIHPSELTNTSAQEVNEQDAEDFARHFLLNGSRRVPVVLVTERHGKGHLVDPDDLAMRLRAVARVYSLSEKAAFALSQGLQQAGCPKVLHCFDGGVRVYPVDFSANTHPLEAPLQIGDVLESLDAERRTSQLAGRIIRWSERSNLPSKFWFSIQEYDRNQEALRNEALLRVIESTDKADAAARVDELEAQLRSVLEERRITEQDRDEALKMAVNADENYKQSEAAYESLYEEYERLKREYDSSEIERSTLREALDQQKANRLGIVLNDEIRESFHAVVRHDASPYQALVVVRTLFPKFVEVLPSALRSAGDFEKFDGDRKLMFELCLKLVTSYRQGLIDGMNDKEAGSIFGTHFSSQESESTKRNPKCVSERTFTASDGRTHVMWSHLRLGNRPDAYATWRLHFSWDSSRSLIVIGHSGRHLATGGS